MSGINSGAFYSLLPQLVLKIDRCDKLLLLLGTNDIAQHKQVPRSQFKINMGLISSSVICSYYPQNIILVSPPAVGKNKQKKRTNQKITSYTSDLIKLATTYKLQFISLFQAMIA